MLLITGTQRSGTSVLSKLLMNLGYDLGTRSWHDDINGGLESPHICWAMRKYLDLPGFPFEGFDEWIGNEVEPMDLSELDKKFDVQKFSFLLMNPNFVRTYLHLRRRKDRFLILTRDPSDVIKSKACTRERVARFYGDHRILKLDAKTLRKRFFECLEILNEGSELFSFLLFPDFLQTPRLVYDKITEFGGLDMPWDDFFMEWDHLIDLGLSHTFKKENEDDGKSSQDI